MFNIFLLSYLVGRQIVAKIPVDHLPEASSLSSSSSSSALRSSSRNDE
jgi:hypothetical protein